MKPGVQDQPGQHGETLPLLKIQKLAGHGGVCLYQLLGRLRHESHLNLGGRGCSQARSCHRTPKWVPEGDSVNNKKEKKRKRESERDQKTFLFLLPGEEVARRLPSPNLLVP